MVLDTGWQEWLIVARNGWHLIDFLKIVADVLVNGEDKNDKLGIVMINDLEWLIIGNVG